MGPNRLEKRGVNLGSTKVNQAGVKDADSIVTLNDEGHSLQSLTYVRGRHKCNMKLCNALT